MDKVFMKKNSPTATTKICSICGKNMPLAEFLLIDRNNKKTISNSCKPCRIKQQAKEANYDDDESGGGGKGNRVGVDKDKNADSTDVKKGEAATVRDRIEKQQDRADHTLEGEDLAHEGETKESKATKDKDKKSDQKADKKTEKSSKTDNKEVKSAEKASSEQIASGAGPKTTAQGLFSGNQRGGEHDAFRNESIGSSADGMFRKPATPVTTNTNDNKSSAASIRGLSSSSSGK